MLEKHTSCVVQSLRVDKVNKTKIWKVARIVNAMFLKRFKKPISSFQIEASFLVFFSVFIIFHSYFWLSFQHQNGKGHISIRRQISIEL